MNDDSEFQQSLIQYLEGCQKGEFLMGSMEYVKSKVPIDLENRTKGINCVFHNESPQLEKHIKIQLRLFLKNRRFLVYLMNIQVVMLVNVRRFY
jgi:hypothetical protein